MVWWWTTTVITRGTPRRPCISNTSMRRRTSTTWHYRLCWWRVRHSSITRSLRVTISSWPWLSCRRVVCRWVTCVRRISYWRSCSGRWWSIGRNYIARKSWISCHRGRVVRGSRWLSGRVSRIRCCCCCYRSSPWCRVGWLSWWKCWLRRRRFRGWLWRLWGSWVTCLGWCWSVRC